LSEIWDEIEKRKKQRSNKREESEVERKWNRSLYYNKTGTLSPEELQEIKEYNSIKRDWTDAELKALSKPNKKKLPIAKKLTVVEKKKLNILQRREFLNKNYSKQELINQAKGKITLYTSMKKGEIIEKIIKKENW